MEKLYTVSKNKTGAGCGSDHELLIAKFRMKLKKVGKTTRLFRYDLNQIPFDYAVEVRNRFKGVDLIDRVPDELWTEVPDIVQETGIKTIPKKKKCKKAKCLSEEALQIPVCREPVRHSTRDKGHEEGGSAYAKAGSSLRSPPGYSRASTPQTPESAYFIALCSHL